MLQKLLHLQLICSREDRRPRVGRAARGRRPEPAAAVARDGAARRAGRAPGVGEARRVAGAPEERPLSARLPQRRLGARSTNSCFSFFPEGLGISWVVCPSVFSSLENSTLINFK